jgi:hypothetical protein
MFNVTILPKRIRLYLTLPGNRKQINKQSIDLLTESQRSRYGSDTVSHAWFDFKNNLSESIFRDVTRNINTTLRTANDFYSLRQTHLIYSDYVEYFPTRLGPADTYNLPCVVIEAQLTDSSDILSIKLKGDNYITTYRIPLENCFSGKADRIATETINTSSRKIRL